MKFPFLAASAEKTAKIDLSAMLDEAQSRNIYVKEERVQTRPALCKTDAVFPPLKAGEEYYHPFRFTDCVIETEGTLYRLGYDVLWDGMAHARVRTFLFDRRGDMRECGEMTFNRVTSELFYVPERVSFFTAAPTAGGGIYAFVYAAASAEEGWYTAFEISADLTSWEAVDSRNYYIPTVYINGRGNCYQEALGANSAYTPAPQFPEALNLLNGRFRAFFSSDGLSSSFQLPVLRLDDETVICRVYQDQSSYAEWIIPYGESRGVATFGGVSVTLECDRQDGILRFKNSSGKAFPIYKMSEYPGNNIFVEAGHDIPEAKKWIYGAGCVATAGEYLYVGGSRRHPGKVLVTRRSHPLYFPQDCVVQIGDDVSPVTALRPFGGVVVAFKPDCIFRIGVTAGRYEITDQTLTNSDTLFHRRDIPYSRPLQASVGCACPETLCQMGNRLVWVEENGVVYALFSVVSGNQRRVEILSDQGQKRLEALFPVTDMRAVANEDAYLLYAGNRAWLFDGKRWLFWQFPEGVCLQSAFSQSEEWIFCGCDGNDESLCYTARLTGDEDVYPISENGQTVVKNTPVEYEIRLKTLDFGTPETDKTVDALCLVARAERPFWVDCGGLRQIVPKVTRTATYFLRPGLYGVSRVPFTLTGTGSAGFEKLHLRYRNLSEVGL